MIATKKLEEVPFTSTYEGYKFGKQIPSDTKTVAFLIKVNGINYHFNKHWVHLLGWHTAIYDCTRTGKITNYKAIYKQTGENYQETLDNFIQLILQK